MARSKRKHKHARRKFWPWLITGLLLIGGGVSLGQGNLFGLLGNNDQSDGTLGLFLSQNDNETEQDSLTLSEVVIRINESDIYWNDQLVTIEDIRTELEQTDETTQFTLIDDAAIKASYDSVIAILTGQAIDFEEAIVQH